jgi:hypothetical protein
MIFMVENAHSVVAVEMRKVRRSTTIQKTS